MFHPRRRKKWAAVLWERRRSIQIHIFFIGWPFDWAHKFEETRKSRETKDVLMVCIESVAVWQIPSNVHVYMWSWLVERFASVLCKSWSVEFFGTSSEFKSICINFAARWLRAPIDPCTLRASFVRTWRRSHDASSHLASAARMGSQGTWTLPWRGPKDHLRSCPRASMWSGPSPDFLDLGGRGLRSQLGGRTPWSDPRRLLHPTALAWVLQATPQWGCLLAGRRGSWGCGRGSIAKAVAEGLNNFLVIFKGEKNGEDASEYDWGPPKKLGKWSVSKSFSIYMNSFFHKEDSFATDQTNHRIWRGSNLMRKSTPLFDCECFRLKIVQWG